MTGPGQPRAEPGRLLLVPNTLDLGTEPLVPLDEVLPMAVIRQAAALGHWVAESAKTTRALLKRVSALVPLALPLQQIQITELPRPAKGQRPGQAPLPDLHALLAPALTGQDIGLMSEAGLPGVADPGAALVAAAHAAGLTVLPLAGPSSLLLALAASGLNGQSFAFVGYLPVDAAARSARIRDLDTLSRRQQQTQIAIETPYRNEALLRALAANLQPDTRLSVASGLTLPAGRCQTLTVQAWRRLVDQPVSPLPTVFCWLAPG